MDLKILVAAHKEVPIPELECYYPVQVGAAINESVPAYLKDNTGDNISSLNHSYSELTGVYWAWKNIQADYIGLVHYRRFFAANSLSSCKKNPKNKDLLTGKTAIKLLGEADIVLPKKRRYFIESVYDHYAHTLHMEDLLVVENIISEQCPNYLEEFLRLKVRRSAHMFNMFIMSKEKFDAYCAWLFPILTELIQQRGTDFSPFHRRYPGRISEILLDVWIYTNQYAYVEQPLVFVGGQQYMKKAFELVKSKVTGNKYDQSF